jgi:hypothetical protein
MYPYPKPIWLHDQRKRVVYKPSALGAIGAPVEGVASFNARFETMSSAGGPGQVGGDGFFGNDTNQSALEMWARNKRLDFVDQAEADRLWSVYEAEWRAK